jgi:hypothetical protein
MTEIIRKDVFYHFIVEEIVLGCKLAYLFPAAAIVRSVAQHFPVLHKSVKSYRL